MVSTLAAPAALFSAPVNECDRVARIAAQEHGVPFKVMAAIARVETGRTIDGDFQPWPWTLNVAGDGAHFPTRSEALQAMHHVTATGQSNFDVGCFQVNARWHGDQFDTAQTMIDPLENARYAAGLLVEHFEVTQDWTLAAGRYHSKTQDFATAYIEKFTDVLNALPDLATPSRPTSKRENSFPLLIVQDGVTVRRGSLVPITTDASRSRLIGG
ncbi:lytic transglycosylase domain-containing protein [Pseudooceanicola sp. MF1-13]|uniref:lytic transglycosylase domain-containing protein n=1 Tax=Pseudooceanicola sp. MF1-13 TaxID=3379095 RepID=UPI003891482E